MACTQRPGAANLPLTPPAAPPSFTPPHLHKPSIPTLAAKLISRGNLLTSNKKIPPCPPSHLVGRSQTVQRVSDPHSSVTAFRFPAAHAAWIGKLLWPSQYATFSGQPYQVSIQLPLPGVLLCPLEAAWATQPGAVCTQECSHFEHDKLPTVRSHLSPARTACPYPSRSSCILTPSSWTCVPPASPYTWPRVSRSR
eukprot:747939-Hanusia_phi.AAC.2